MTVFAWLVVYYEWNPDRASGRMLRALSYTKGLAGQGTAVPIAAFVTCMSLFFLSVPLFEWRPSVWTILPSLLAVVLALFSIVLIGTTWLLRWPSFLIAPRFRGYWMFRQTPPDVQEFFSDTSVPPRPEDSQLAFLYDEFLVFVRLHAAYALAIYYAEPRPTAPFPDTAAWASLSSRLRGAIPGTAERENWERVLTYVSQFDVAQRQLRQATWPSDMQSLRGGGH